VLPGWSSSVDSASPQGTPDLYMLLKARVSLNPTGATAHRPEGCCTPAGAAAGEPGRSCRSLLVTQSSGQSSWCFPPSAVWQES